MPIRHASIADCDSITNLLEQLGYSLPVETIKNRLQKLLDSDCDDVFVFTENNTVEGFLTLHYSIQLAFDGNFCEIGYFVVDKDARSKGIGKLLEEFTCKTAKKKGCSAINVFSKEIRIDAHRFYQRQGYNEIRKFFSKDLRQNK